jgi:hypothetical protein
MSNPQLPIDHSTAIYQSLHWYHAHVTYCMFMLTLWFSKASQEFFVCSPVVWGTYLSNSQLFIDARNTTIVRLAV